MKTYTAAVIGCGSRAPAHIDCYHHIPNARVIACCAPSPQRREPLAAKHGLRAYADPATMIREEKPDIVHLITWPDTRVPLMALVADLGVPLCTVEKPIASGVTDWHRLQALQASSSTRFAVCHQMRWQKHLTRCRQAMTSGGLGAPLFLDMSAGMNISGQGTHTLNYGRSLIGDPEVTHVFANAHGWDAADTGHPAPLATEASLVFANGVRGSWTSGPVSPRCGDPTTTWQHVRVAAYAEEGRVLYEEFGRWEVVGPDLGEAEPFGGIEAWQQNNQLAQAAFHQAMFVWLEGGLEPGTSLRASLHEWAVVLALYQSALERRPIKLADFDPPDDLVTRVRSALQTSQG